MSTIAFRCSGALDRSDLWCSAVLTVPTAHALAAFAFVGLPVDTWGAFEVRELAPLVRRGLWPSRKARPNVRAVLVGLLNLVDRAGDEGTIVFSVENESACR